MAEFFDGAGRFDLEREVAEVGHVERLEKQAAVGSRVDAHALEAARRDGGNGFAKAAILVEELLRFVGAKPLLEQLAGARG